MKIPFTKMSGAGNDFIVIDNRAGALPEAGRRERVIDWCRRRVGIGADGVLLVEPPQENDGAHFRMRYYNADGGEAESCGNGSRCIARFAHLAGAAPAHLRFETLAGMYEAEVGAGERNVVLSMSDPRDLRRDLTIRIPDLFEGRADFINTGVPHTVIMWPELEEAPVVALGRAVRTHAMFAPAGTNVNFVAPRPGGGVAIRTYERGVEDETLACGTGSVASALVASLHGLAQSPVPVYTRGGPILKIHFEREGETFRQIKLEGEARIVYDGFVQWNENSQ